MQVIEDFLKRVGVESYEDLNDLEKEEYDRWLQAMASSEITPIDVKNYIAQMKNAVVMQLADEPEYIHSNIFPFLKRSNPVNMYLKARLKNYILLEAFLGRPDQARAALESHLKQIKPMV